MKTSPKRRLAGVRIGSNAKADVQDDIELRGWDRGGRAAADAPVSRHRRLAGPVAAAGADRDTADRVAGLAPRRGAGAWRIHQDRGHAARGRARNAASWSLGRGDTAVAGMRRQYPGPGAAA